MSDNNLEWDNDALELLGKIPIFVRGMAKKKIEKAALKQGEARVTVELIKKVQKKHM